MKKNKLRILKDDNNQMMCILLEDNVMYEGTFESFKGYEHIADVCRTLGFSVVEEGYTYE